MAVLGSRALFAISEEGKMYFSGQMGMLLLYLKIKMSPIWGSKIENIAVSLFVDWLSKLVYSKQ